MQQGAGVGMLGVLKDVIDAAGLNNVPGVHHDDPVAQLRDDAQVVGDIDDRRPEFIPQATDQVDDLGLQCDV